jgi:serine/threonine protein kinase/tetratricopeptide (TPR) repeat protein
MIDVVADDTADNLSSGWFGGLYRWLKRLSPPPETPSGSAGDNSQDPIPSKIGHYTVRRKLGAGGMGVVYEAHDERLKRTVALKLMLSLGHDEASRKRFWREARAAASVNHPHVCQVYDVGEDGGTLFIAMELLEGEPLNKTLKRGPLSVDQALQIAVDMLAALAAIHARGIVHRDLKPSNVFFTGHGIKLLDFGLARPELQATEDSLDSVTRSGAVFGTPGYMAPEQIAGDAVDARSDLFAVGAILFEMLAGRPAFSGRTVMAVVNATLTEQPPALAGPPAVAAVDRVIRRALAKNPDGRPESAQAMLKELGAARNLDGQESRAMARALTRVVVLPFRVLRPDPDIDFLAFSLPDAITTSLAGMGSLIVRSSATAARFAGEAPDIKVLAVEADVDRVVMGTLLRSGDELRAATQLVEAPEGTLLTSHTVQSPLGDLFRMQDDIARRVVEGLALPLTGERPSAPEAPDHPRAYELYLRANELARTYDGMLRARALYEQCVELDPDFAPAWARLGRCLRVIGKYIDPTPDSDRRAEDAFVRAITLSPRLSLAHKFYANLEADTGRAREGIIRLLNEAMRHGNDPELFAGLVHACRYAGLFEESIAAHAEARRLDPKIATSLLQTLLMTGDIERLIAIDSAEHVHGGGDEGIRVIGLGFAGRRDEARRALERLAHGPASQTFEAWTAHLAAWLDRRVDDMLSTMSVFAPLKIFDDPEAIFQEGWFFCDVGEHQRGLDYLQRAVARGYFPAVTLTEWPQFDALRDAPAFQALLAAAEAGRERARAAFRDAGGNRLLAH